MSNFLWLLDAGHGGMRNGVYTTAPSKMHVFPDGLTIHEGVVNRHICNWLIMLLNSEGIEYVKIHDEVEDTPLQVRVQAADNIYRQDSRCIYLSIHSNAGRGQGFEIFTSLGRTKSDKIADIFAKTYKKMFPEFKFRSDLVDGDDVKDRDFYVLRKTDCPALLVENLFFDNRKEAEFLLSASGQKRIAQCLFEGIKEVERIQPI